MVLGVKAVMFIRLVPSTEMPLLPLLLHTYSFGSGKTSALTMMTCPGQRPWGRAREQGTS